MKKQQWLTIRKAKAGQTLAELAIILPLFGLLIFTGFQLTAACLNLVILQTKAAEAIRQIPDGTQASSLSPLVEIPLWGRTVVPTQLRSSQLLQPSRFFKPVFLPPVPIIQTQKSSPYVITLHLDSTLLPGGGFAEFLSPVSMRLTAETILAPHVQEGH